MAGEIALLLLGAVIGWAESLYGFRVSDSRASLGGIRQGETGGPGLRWKFATKEGDAGGMPAKRASASSRLRRRAQAENRLLAAAEGRERFFLSPPSIFCYRH